MCYGSIDDSTGKSYTQIEYDRAKELGLDILIYLIDENRGVIKTGNIDFGDKKIYLDNFKRILKSNHTIDFFIDSEDLSRKIYQRLKNIFPDDELMITRPRELECNIERIKLGNSEVCVFITFFHGKPFEIFTCLNDECDDLFFLSIPNAITKGYITKREDDEFVSYDFTFKNKRGYRTTFEGINVVWDANLRTNDSIVSSLLQNNVRKKAIYHAIRQLEIESEKLKPWNGFIIDILDKYL